MDSQVIEVSKLRGENKVIEAKANQSVYIADVDESQVLIRGKCIKVVVIDVKKSFIAVHGVISAVEVTRAKNSAVFLGQGSMMNIEQCTECRIGTSSEWTELRLRRNVGLSLVTVPPMELDQVEAAEVEAAMLEQREQHLPEEIKAELAAGKLSFSIGTDY